MRSIIVNPFTPIPKSDKSHVRGWAMVWAQRLGADIATKDSDLSGYDNIYIDHGVNFSGSLNLFGGFTDDIVDRLQTISFEVKKGAKLYSLDHNIDDCKYVDQIEKRIDSKTTSDSVDFDFLIELDKLMSVAKKLTMSDLDLTSVIVGDSHSVAYSHQNQIIHRINGQLLYSAMKQSIKEWVRPFMKQGIKDVTLCLGSIDIRFHVFGKRNAGFSDEFAIEYAKQIIEAQNYWKVPFAVCAPVPIEHEARKIPKTGRYKGANFNGSRVERLNYTKQFIERLDSYCIDFDLLIPPTEWYDMSGEQYAKKIMELSSSVHIAPSYYNSIIKW